MENSEKNQTGGSSNSGYPESNEDIHKATSTSGAHTKRYVHESCVFSIFKLAIGK